MLMTALLTVGACVLGAELHEFSHYLQARMHGRDASLDPISLEVRWTEPEPTIDRRIQLTPIVCGLAAGAVYALVGGAWTLPAVAFWLVFTFGGSADDYQSITGSLSTAQWRLVLALAGFMLLWLTEYGVARRVVPAALYWPLWALAAVVGISQLVLGLVAADDPPVRGEAKLP